MLKRGDFVTTQTQGLGRVIRVARDGSWVDVRWFDFHGEFDMMRKPGQTVAEWSKRMRPEFVFKLKAVWGEPAQARNEVTDG